MAIILGIDAAWTVGQPSGVALLDSSEVPVCVAAAPSYQAFCDISYGRPLDWNQRQKGEEPNLNTLLDAAEDLVSATVDVIAVDMPMATVAISGRRTADNAISKEYGANWCSAHSPSSTRPGAISSQLIKDAAARGYPLATSKTVPGRGRRLIEVYPHPALLTLMSVERRVTYKIAKARKYWPGLDSSERRAKISQELVSIERRLAEVLGPLPLPEMPENPEASVLKRREDTIDAIVSAWVGLLYVAGEAVPYGDDTGAVWCPVKVHPVQPG